MNKNTKAQKNPSITLNPWLFTDSDYSYPFGKTNVI